MASDDHCLVDAESKASATYSEPHRHYHDQRHLDDSLAELDAVDGLAQRDRRLLRWAILWHDAVYDPTRTDNEEQSAELARRELTNCGVAQADANEVERLILLAKGHRVDPVDRLGALLVSIDLAILGSDPGRYRDYAADVRREYAHLSDADWRSGRSAVLKRLLEADPLFPDSTFRARLESQARRNLQAELKALGEG